MFRSIFILAIFAINLKLHNVESARILAIIPTPSYSHQVFFQRFWRELAVRGHDIVVITTDPTGDDCLSNFKEISIKESYSKAQDFFKAFINNNIFGLVFSGEWSKLLIGQMDFQMSLPQIRALIDNQTEHFDLVFVEHFISPLFGFKHHFNCPFIGVNSLDAAVTSHEIMGNPIHSALYPMALFSGYGCCDFAERLLAMLATNAYELINYYKDREMFNTLLKKHFGEDTPDIFELMESTDMLFVNANPIFSSIRPLTPSMINLAGGMHIMPPQKLPGDLQQFLDSAENGVIYFSLGSNVKSKDLPEETKTAMVTALSQVSYKVLWKFEDDKLFGKPENVKIIKWAPQQDILRHKNVKLFITQGGLQSLEETIHSAIPVVVIPFFADQQSNADKIQAKGLGIIMDRNNITAHGFKSAILEVITNPKYKETLLDLQKKVLDEPMTPLDKAVWWTEYVLRHKGAQHLKGPRIPLYQYYYLDVIALFTTIVLFCSVVAVKILKYSLRSKVKRGEKNVIKKNR